MASLVDSLHYWKPAVTFSMTEDSTQYHNIKMTAILTQVVTFLKKNKGEPKKQSRDKNINLYKNDYTQCFE